MCTHVDTCMYTYVFVSVVEGTMLAPPKPRIINYLRKQVLVTEEGRKEKHQKTASHRVTGLWCCYWGPTSPNSFPELRTGLQYLPRTPTVNKTNSLLFFLQAKYLSFQMRVTLYEAQALAAPVLRFILRPPAPLFQNFL